MPKIADGWFSCRDELHIGVKYFGLYIEDARSSRACRLVLSSDGKTNANHDGVRRRKMQTWYRISATKSKRTHLENAVAMTKQRYNNEIPSFTGVQHEHFSQYCQDGLYITLGPNNILTRGNDNSKWGIRYVNGPRIKK